MRTWIFQGNPELFDIDGYLSTSAGLIVWRVARYAEQITPGDSAYIWRSSSKETPAGIVAEGTITDIPSVRPNDAETE